MAVPFCDFCCCTSARDPESPNCLGILPFPSFSSFRPKPEAIPFLLQPLEIIEVDPALPEIFYDPNVPHYNLTGQKLHYIFCGFSIPREREGVRNVADSFSETFHHYGFIVRIFHNMDNEKIIEVISKVSQQDHSRTSCLWVTIMCLTRNGLHAGKGSYGLSEIVFLLQSKNLAGKPKILMVPSLRGGNEMPGICAWLPQPPQEGSISCLPCDVMTNIYNSCYDWVNGCFAQQECPQCPVCAARNSDSGNTVRLASGETKVLPKTSDLIIMHAPNNGNLQTDLMSICDLMRATRDVFEEVEVEIEHGDLIPMINQKVANLTTPGEVIVIPETRMTLTKTLRFTRTVPHRN